MNTKLYSLNITDLEHCSKKVIPITQEQKDFLDFLSSQLYLDTDCFSFKTKDITDTITTALKAISYFKEE